MPLPSIDRVQQRAEVEESSVMQTVVRESKPPRRIHHIQFAMMDADEMAKVAMLQVVTNMLYSPPNSTQTSYGVLDQRLGTSQKTGTCQTCGEKIEFCVGHFGFLRLELPVFHIGFFKATMTTLQCICKTCARLLLPEDQIRDGLMKRRRNPHLETLTKKNMAQAVIEKCKRCKVCPHCGAFNGSVKKARPLKIFHECFPANYKKTQPDQDAFKKRCAGAMEFNKDVEQHINKAQDAINPSKVQSKPRRVRCVCE